MELDVDYNEFMNDFSIIFNEIFFIFKLENCLSNNFNEKDFKFMFSSNCSIEFRKKKYFYPFVIQYQNKSLIDTVKVYELMKKIPLFRINFHDRKSVYLNSSDRKIYAISASELSKHDEEIRYNYEFVNEKFMKHMEKSVSVESISNETISVLDTFGFRYENFGQYLQINNENGTTIITKIPKILLPQTLKYSSLIIEDLKYIYESISKKHKSNKLISLGYFEVYKNRNIDHQQYQHLAIIKNNEIYDVLD